MSSKIQKLLYTAVLAPAITLSSTDVYARETSIGPRPEPKITYPEISARKDDSINMIAALSAFIGLGAFSLLVKCCIKDYITKKQKEFDEFWDEHCKNRRPDPLAQRRKLSKQEIQEIVNNIRSKRSGIDPAIYR